MCISKREEEKAAKAKEEFEKTLWDRIRHLFRLKNGGKDQVLQVPHIPPPTLHTPPPPHPTPHPPHPNVREDLLGQDPPPLPPKKREKGPISPGISIHRRLFRPGTQHQVTSGDFALRLFWSVVPEGLRNMQTE